MRFIEISPKVPTGPSLEPLQTLNSQNCSDVPQRSALGAANLNNMFCRYVTALVLYFHGQMSCPERLEQGWQSASIILKWRSHFTLRRAMHLFARPRLAAQLRMHVHGCCESVYVYTVVACHEPTLWRCSLLPLHKARSRPSPIECPSTRRSSRLTGKKHSADPRNGWFAKARRRKFNRPTPSGISVSILTSSIKTPSSRQD